MICFNGKGGRAIIDHHTGIIEALIKLYPELQLKKGLILELLCGILKFNVSAFFRKDNF
jgi:hypothetical protein